MLNGSGDRSLLGRLGSSPFCSRAANHRKSTPSNPRNTPSALISALKVHGTVDGALRALGTPADHVSVPVLYKIIIRWTREARSGSSQHFHLQTTFPRNATEPMYALRRRVAAEIVGRFSGYVHRIWVDV